MKRIQWLRNTRVAAAVLSVLLCADEALSSESRSDARPVLRVPSTDAKPNIDGKLDEPCWKDAARTGPFEVTPGEPASSTTEAFISRDAEHLYVGVLCRGKDAAEGSGPGQTSSFTPGKNAEHARSEVDKLLGAHWAVTPFKPSKEV